MEVVSESRDHKKYLLGFKQHDIGTNRRSISLPLAQAFKGC